MRSSTLQAEHFGPFHNSDYNLQPGMTQTMVYSPTDKGLCYMTDQQQVSHQYDINTGKKQTKELTVQTSNQLVYSIQKASNQLVITCH